MTILLCYSICMLQYYHVTILSCYSIIMLQYYCITILLCYNIIMLQYYHVTILLCYSICMLQYYYITIFLCYKISILVLSFSHPATVPPFSLHHLTLSISSPLSTSFSSSSSPFSFLSSSLIPLL